MNIEANLKKLKTSIKRRKKITLTLMLGFLMTGVIGYADDPTVQELQQKIQELQSKIEQIESKNQEIESKFNSENVLIGKDAGENGKGSIAIGEKAKINNYVDQNGSIAIGQNAFAESMVGKQEKYFAFNKNIKYSGFGFGSVPENNIDKLISTLVIGNNTYARSGGIMIGPHNFRGKMGDLENISTDTDEEKRKLGVGVLSTTLGTNSFTNGAFATTLGAYSIITSQYNGDNYKYASQNFGALINGPLNSIESFSSDSGYSGIANSVVGVANRTNNSNGSLIFGAGNEITNSIEDVRLSLRRFESPKELTDKLREEVKNKKGGGATLAIGGGNTADYTRQVTMIGTRNEVKGTESKKTELVSVSGDNNLVENSRNIVAGKNFHVTGEGNILQGFNNLTNNERRKVTNNNVVALGNDIKINTDNSVYLGTNSTEAKDDNTLWRNKKDDIDKAYKDYAGFNNIGGIVTVGNDTLTRVIQNVAPGLISATSTDAINGSQLFNYVAKQYITVKDGKGNSTQVKLGDTLTLKGTTVEVTVKGPESKQTNTTPAKPKVQEHTATFEVKGNVGGSNTFEYVLGEKVLSEEEYSKLKSDDKKNVILRVKDGEKVITNVANGVKANDAANISQLNDVKSKLQKDIKEVDKKSDLALGGVANAVAIANLVQVNSYSDYRHNLSAAYGYYGGSHALAIGFSGVTKDRRLVYKLSGSVNNKGNLAFGVGAGVMLGNKEESMEHKDINVKELYEKISKLEKENSEFREMFKKLGVMK
ncbi:YadA-like family protein [uncultured Sneathia sp.]|uniref:YadA-like family protein n=1 Tax=uncultured Sneathia sp. TaxID=278067 RepID=UPI0025923731|nr:YadA-like family protein [uncultured Sneathia sp.]